ncbi:MAG TPA: hypothetical protein VID47_10795, partial [Actinomycetota bacterium]
MTIQDTATRTFDAAIGASDLVAEKARTFAGGLKEFDVKTSWARYQKEMTTNFDQLAVRGAKLRKSVKDSAPAKRAAAQTTTAKRQVKAAATSIRKAVAAD